ncbi:hypothetical protein Acr_13g0003090 [Actinidia rufa]|uniref:Uncharacterized protein n=1 Tax=Actinidia rufa TaxID=165716 RepID=A0A7J0FJN4_9ERIC|nr:hypothetical protein Acr_13g0003090 [Actinidia rufa]
MLNGSLNFISNAVRVCFFWSISKSREVHHVRLRRGVKSKGVRKVVWSFSMEGDGGSRSFLLLKASWGNMAMEWSSSVHARSACMGKGMLGTLHWGLSFFSCIVLSVVLDYFVFRGSADVFQYFSLLFHELHFFHSRFSAHRDKVALLGCNLIPIKRFFASGGSEFNDLLQCEGNSIHPVKSFSTNDRIIGRRNVYNYKLGLQLLKTGLDFESHDTIPKDPILKVRVMCTPNHVNSPDGEAFFQGIVGISPISVKSWIRSCSIRAELRVLTYDLARQIDLPAVAAPAASVAMHVSFSPTSLGVQSMVKSMSESTQLGRTLRLPKATAAELLEARALCLECSFWWSSLLVGSSHHRLTSDLLIAASRRRRTSDLLAVAATHRCHHRTSIEVRSANCGRPCAPLSP